MGNVNKFRVLWRQVERVVGMFAGTTIDELLDMVQKAENNVKTEIRLQEEIRAVPVVPMEYEFYRPVYAPVMVGVA